MRKFLGLSLSIALGFTALAAIPAAAASENSRNNIGDIVQIGDNSTWLVFGSATEVKTFFVSIPDGSGGASRNGRLTVETQNGFCCTDYWGVRIIKHNGQDMASAVGDGSGAGIAPPVSPDEWSGAATIPALPQKGVTVEVYYDRGSDIFGAGMWVRFLFTGENILVTPVP